MNSYTIATRERVLDIGPESPLFILGWEPDGSRGLEENLELYRAEWALLPASIRDHAVTVLGLGCLQGRGEEFLKLSEDEGIPFLVQVRTWVPSWHPRWADHPEPVVLPPEVERLYKRYAMMRGVQAVELNCFGFSTEEKQYMIDLMEISARHGRVVSWQEANDGCNIYIEAGCDREFYEAMRRYKDYILPQWEMNITRSMYLCHDSCFGLWLADLAGDWGVEPQSWYWDDAGFTTLNAPGSVVNSGYRQGDRNMMPDQMWGQMMLLGLSSGATVYSLEPMSGFIGPRGGLSRTWRTTVFPLWRAMLEKGLIPGREQVKKKIRVAYHADFERAADSEWSDVDYFRHRRYHHPIHGDSMGRGSGSGTLYQGTYGIRHECECIPNTGRYYWIPVLPKYAKLDELVQYQRIIRPNYFANETEVQNFFNSLYEGDGRGTAWVVEAGGTVFVSQTHENYDVREDYDATFAGPGVRRVSGTVGAHHYLLLRKEGRGLWALANNYPGRRTVLSVELDGESDGPPAVESRRQGAIVSTRWDPESSVFEITVEHEGTEEINVLPSG